MSQSIHLCASCGNTVKTHGAVLCVVCSKQRNGKTPASIKAAKTMRTHAQIQSIWSKKARALAKRLTL